MTLHPLAHLFLVAAMISLAATVPPALGINIILMFGVFTLIMPSRTEARLAGAFIRMLAVAAVFLVLINGIAWPAFTLDDAGLRVALASFSRIAAPITAILYLSRAVTGEEMFALLVGLRLPPPLILIVFRTLWLVPRFVERTDDVVTAQRLRGMPVDSILRRARAILPTLGPLFSSMLHEITENALTLSTRGFMRPGRKTHLASLRWRAADTVAVAGVVLVLVMAWS